MRAPRRARPSLATGERLAQVLSTLLTGRSVDRVWRTGRASLLIRFSGRDKRRLWLDLDDDRPSWALTLDWPETPDRPGAQTLRLRSAMEGWRVDAVALVEERGLAFDLSRGGRERTLRVQLAGRYLNIAVEGAELEEPVALLLDRPPFDPESPPLRPGAPLVDLPDDGPWMSEVERLWTRAREAIQLERDQIALRRRLREAQKRSERSLAKIGRDLERARGAEENRRMGDLVKTMLGRIPHGADHVEAVDYSSEGCPTVRVDLDPSMDGVANMERYYKAYRRFNEAGSAIEARFQRESARLEELTEVLERVDQLPMEDAAAGRDELQACSERAAAIGVRERPPTRAPGREIRQAVPYRTFLSADGARILVGRSAKDNDALTFRVARGRDIWLHARDVAGSHVVIPVERGGTPSHETLLDAAHLALHFSRARGEGAGDVQWTEKKHVRRAPGAGAGRVMVSAGRTLRVSFDDQRLTSLYERRPEAGNEA